MRGFISFIIIWCVAMNSYAQISYEDGVNANKQAMHYIKNEKQVKSGEKIKVKMARNGGFAAVLTLD